MHDEPDDESSKGETLEKLSPAQSITIKTECSHHPIEHLFVRPDERRAAFDVELLDLFELDLPELCHVLQPMWIGTLREPATRF